MATSKLWNIIRRPSAANPIVDVYRSVRMAIAGLRMGSYSDANGDKKESIVTSPKDERALVNFDRLFINNTQGAAIPIRQVADLE